MSLAATLKECRAAIRAHRDARGDDRCWVDDLVVWSFLEDQPPEPAAPPAFDAAMKKCRDFYEHRRAVVPDIVPAGVVSDSRDRDADLAAMTTPQLEAELVRLRAAVRRHRDTPLLTIEDDRALYRVLPENLPADFRLPPEPEFLGDAKAPHAGCPSFWRSHGQCAVSRHNLHRWGPCAPAAPRDKK